MGLAMTKVNVIRFEATDIAPGLSEDTAFLTMDTKEDGRVTVHMKRPVFELLFESMQLALNEEALRASPQTTD